MDFTVYFPETSSGLLNKGVPGPFCEMLALGNFYDDFTSHLHMAS